MRKRNAILIPALLLSTLSFVAVYGVYRNTAPAFGFSPGGAHPVETHHPLQNSEGLSAGKCKECHSKEYGEWNGSRHNAAWRNKIFQHGFLLEPAPNCVHCHAPLKEQTHEVKTNWSFYMARSPAPFLRHKQASSTKSDPERLAHEGVTCSVCHMRQGKIIASDPGHSSHRLHAKEIRRGIIPCKRCHTQPEELLAALSFGTHSDSPIDTDSPQTGEASGEDPARSPRCSGCHDREWNQKSGSEFHKTAYNPELKDSRFCASCHQFNIPSNRNGILEMTDVPMQNTYGEWLSYRKGGGTKSCQECHMPGGRHIFRGAHDRKFLTSSVELIANRTKEGVLFSLRSVETGHNNPTGDLLRHYTLEVEEEPGEFRVIKRIGRTFHLVADNKTGEIKRDVKENSALRPFRTLKILHKTERHPLRYRLLYHYTSEKDEMREFIESEKIIAPIIEGIVP